MECTNPSNLESSSRTTLTCFPICSICCNYAFCARCIRSATRAKMSRQTGYALRVTKIKIYRIFFRENFNNQSWSRVIVKSNCWFIENVLTFLKRLNFIVIYRTKSLIPAVVQSQIFHKCTISLWAHEPYTLMWYHTARTQNYRGVVGLIYRPLPSTLSCQSTREFYPVSFL